MKDVDIQDRQSDFVSCVCIVWKTDLVLLKYSINYRYEILNIAQLLKIIRHVYRTFSPYVR